MTEADQDDSGQPLESDFSAAQERAANPSNAAEWSSLRVKSLIAKQWLGGGGGGTTNVFLGDATVQSLGDHYTGSMSSHIGVVVNSGTVPSSMLAAIRASYVEPTGHTRVRQVLETHQLVVINATEGTGRTTTALRVLDDLCREGVLKLDPITNLRELDGAAFSDLHGYLLESPDPEQTRELGSFHADRLSALMKDKGCMLVVIADSTTRLQLKNIAHLVVDDIGEVEPANLLRRHVDHALEGAGCEESVLDLPEVQEIVAELTADVPRRELADLAALLVDVARGQNDVTTVRERYSRTSETIFTEWFNAQEDIEQRAFVIALSVFNDESVQLVSRAASLLADMMKAVEFPRRTDRARPLFATPLTDRLDRARARVVDDFEDTPLGRVAVRKVRFRDDQYPTRVLRHVCTEYDQAFTVVAKWLFRLGGDLGGRVRARAGTAVGFLSMYDFFGIYDAVVLPWADANDKYMREAAVTALQFSSDHPSFGHVVHRFLEKWLRDRDNWSRRKTAARAVGWNMSISVKKALRLLKRAARNVDWTTAYVIGESVNDLFLRDEDPKVILDALVSWCDDDQSPLRKETAMLAVLMASNYLTIAVAESAEKWPALIWLAENKTEERVAVVRLYARMLQAAAFMDRGYRQVSQWARAAQRDQSMREPIARLLCDIAIEMNDVESMRHYLELWRDRPNGPADAARVVLDHFDEKGV